MATNPQAIAGALPELVKAEQELSRLAAVRGIRYRIAPFGGVRSQADTTEILGYRDQEYKLYVDKMRKDGRVPLPINVWRPIAPFGNSHHNYGAAFDIRPTTWPAGKSLQWAHDELDNIVKANPQLGLRAGDYFNDEPHMELALPLAEVKAKWEKLGKVPGGKTLVPIIGTLAVLGLLALALLRRG